MQNQKPRVFRHTWRPQRRRDVPFSLWVVRAGPEYFEMTRYFDKWQDAIDYVMSGRCDKELHRIQMGG